MSSQITLKVDDEKKRKEKKFPCFFCKKTVLFYGEYVKSDDGKRKAVLFNEDGTPHVHDKSENKEQREQYKRSKSARWRRWWFGYGQYRFKHGYKDEYNRYRAEDYNDAWKENKRRRDEYKQQYENKNLSIEEALKVLEIAGDDFKNCIAKFFNKFVDDKILIKVVKDAYRKLALKFHPDRLPNGTQQEKAEAQTKFIKATEAYELLEKKFKYTS